MVPIRTESPVGAIGAYWATTRQPDDSAVDLLQALADTTAVALENVRVYQELEARVRCRTEELQETVAQLRQAAQEIRSLRGLIPICAHCKNIRDDEGYWHQLEQYLTVHTEARFSHGICPVCLKQHFGLTDRGSAPG